MSKYLFLSKIIVRIYYGVCTISTNTLHKELRIKGIKVLSQKSSVLSVCVACLKCGRAEDGETGAEPLRVGAEPVLLLLDVEI
jgi:hypothetical protein